MWPFSQTEKKTKFWDYKYSSDRIKPKVLIPYGKKYLNFEYVRCNKPREDLTDKEWEYLLSKMNITLSDVKSGYKEIYQGRVQHGRKEVYEYSYATCCGYDESGFQIR